MDTQEIRDLVEDATRHHGAPWKRVVSSDGGFYGVTDRNGSVVAGSPAVSQLIAQAPTIIPAILSRLEQAELERDEWRGKFDEAETARIYSDAQVDRVREFLEYRRANSAVARVALRALDGDNRG